MPAVLAAGRFHDLYVNPREPATLSAPALHTLLSFTPATPPLGVFDGVPSSEHVRYAQLVLEASVRREVRAAGVRIEQHARETIEGTNAVGYAPATFAAATAARLESVVVSLERHMQYLGDRLDAAGGAGPGPHPLVSVPATQALPAAGACRVPKFGHGV